MACTRPRICCAVAAIFLIISAVVLISLVFTIFKPKDPEVALHPFGYDHIQPINGSVNVTLPIIITIENPNYSSFKFENTTGYIDYHGDIVADIPLEEGFVPALDMINITTSADLMAEKIITNPEFFLDLLAGSLNMTSTTVLHGKVNVLKMFNLHATILTTCDISVYMNYKGIQSVCNSEIKL